ncbi:MAG: pyridoxamine 5'-phosphate oxidase [Pseudomonadales bacterium]|nr:pyridoxamine 5'-phosphate oxidase [Pseudomonadales bacterium]
MDLNDKRREYGFANLDWTDLLASPFDQFSLWMNAAIDAGIQDPTAMVVSTVGAGGEPSARIVLLKEFGPDGFCFYTNFESHKSRDIGINPQVVLHFPWLAMDRQVIVNGTAQRLPSEHSRVYFATRPRESQIAAWVSHHQSEVIPSRGHLDGGYEEVSARFKGSEIPMPDFWGGFVVAPHRFEFWQGGEFRLHDRFRYEQRDDTWQIDRLSP